jgi:hypothetical protein
MPKSIKSSQPLREKLSINSFPKDKADSEAVLQQLAKPQTRRMLKRKSPKRKPRNNSPRRKKRPHLHPKKKRQISEISLDDTHPPIYSKQQYHQSQRIGSKRAYLLFTTNLHGDRLACQNAPFTLNILMR